MEQPAAKQPKIDDSPPSPASVPASTIPRLSLIWLDSSIETSDENLAAQAQLRALDLSLKVYQNEHDCENYIKYQPNQSQIILITNGGLGSGLVPRVNDLEQINSIYVYCADKERHEKWAKTYSKVKLVTTQFFELRDTIYNNHFHPTLPIIEEPIDEHENAGTGMYEFNIQHIIADISLDYLSEMQRTNIDKDEFILLCQNEIGQDSIRRAILQRFQEDNGSDRILTWFNHDPMFNRILLKAFQYLNIHTMYRCRYLIQEIQKYFDQHKQTTPVQVYRGAKMSNELLRDLKSSEGKIIGIKSILTTTFDRSMAVFFCTTDQNVQKSVLFEIDANPQLEGVKTFAKTSPSDVDGLQDGIVFMIGSLFQINQIREDENDVTIIRMTLCANEQINSIRTNLKKINEEKNFIGFIQLQYNLSTDLNYPDILLNIDKLLETYLNNSSVNNTDRIRAYDLLGNLLVLKQQFDRSLIFYEKSLELKQKIVPINDLNLVDSYNYIGCVYLAKKENLKALDAFKQVLAILKQIHGEDSFDLIQCYVRMSEIYEFEGNYTDVLFCYNHMFNIMLKHFSIDDGNFAFLYNNMGKTFVSLGQYSLALGYYQTSLDIKLKHQISKELIAGNHRSIGFVYKQVGNKDQARRNFEEAKAIYSELHSSTHKTVEEIQQLIESLST